MIPGNEILWLLLLGLAAGVMGGLLGIGGSVIMIPVLTLFLNKNQHLSQATAMIVNFCIAVPAMLRHNRAKMVRWDVMIRILPFGLVFILLGVEASNRMSASLLMRCFGIFLAYVIVRNVMKLFSGNTPNDTDTPPAQWLGAGVVGVCTGFAAGLLGIGGGIVAVPLLQRMCHLPLRQCIATSSALMCITSVLGACRKNLTLELLDPPQMVSQSLLIAACLAPTAIIGSMIGANLTHALPLKWVRIAFITLLLAACIRYLT